MKINEKKFIEKLEHSVKEVNSNYYDYIVENIKCIDDLENFVYSLIKQCGNKNSKITLPKSPRYIKYLGHVKTNKPMNNNNIYFFVLLFLQMITKTNVVTDTDYTTLFSGCRKFKCFLECLYYFFFGPNLINNTKLIYKVDEIKEFQFIDLIIKDNSNNYFNVACENINNCLLCYQCTDTSDSSFCQSSMKLIKCSLCISCTNCKYAKRCDNCINLNASIYCDDSNSLNCRKNIDGGNSFTDTKYIVNKGLYDYYIEKIRQYNQRCRELLNDVTAENIKLFSCNRTNDYMYMIINKENKLTIIKYMRRVVFIQQTIENIDYSFEDITIESFNKIMKSIGDITQIIGN